MPRIHAPARLLPLALLLALGACRNTASPPATTGEAPAPASAPAATPAAATPAADDNLNAVAWMQTSVEYDAVTYQTYHAAAQLLDRALAEKWDALVPEERPVQPGRLEPAVILDVDETVLDNSPYQARLIADGGEYDEAGWGAWVSEAKARPVPGVLEFARAAQAKGVTVLYLSNRAVHLKDATLANLRNAGLPVKDDSVFLGLGTFVKDCEQNGSEKTCRRQLAGRRYRVLMQFGDQLGDFVQVLANTPDGRRQLYTQQRDWFGSRWWMLPNPSYGSWEPALFNNDFTQARELRRAAKRGALRLDR